MSYVLERNTAGLFDLATRPRTARVRRPPKPVRAPRILLVDDDATIRMLCTVSLELQGMSVLTAEDGGRGFEVARRERPDLIVLDVSMPGLGGFELAELLQRHRWTRRIPFMFLSGNDGNDARAQALGAFAYLGKPFDPTEFASLIADRLDWSDAEPVNA